MNFTDFFVRLSVCFLLSFILGVERQYRRRSLGLRTMILVSIGSYMFVSFSFLNTGYQSDISRIAAQVVAGIGFLGAGVIIKDNEKNRVSGLTTAATLWCDAGIGVLCAGGFIYEALAATLFVLFANIVLREINKMINRRVKDLSTNETFGVVLHINDNDKVMEYITNIINRDNSMSSDNFKVSEKKISFNIMVKKTSEKRVDSFINNLVSEFKIKEYEYKKIEEIELEENYEL